MTNEIIRADEVVRELRELAGNDDDRIYAPENPYGGIASGPFSEESVEILLQEIPQDDVEIRPDGLIYLPEIKYRRILNRAFGPGAWSILPREIRVSEDETMLYYRGALFVHGRFVSEAIGEQPYSPSNERMTYATAAESAKSNCLMRCCKDLGIASELWDPAYVRRWVSKHAVEVWCLNVGSNPGDRGKKRRMWRKKTAEPIDMFPWKEDADRDAPLNRPFQQKSSVTAQRTMVTMDNGGSWSPNVSYKQARRFQAIARDRGWTNDELKRLLAIYGFAKADDITRNEYDRICAALDSPTIHTELRDDLDHENPTPDDDYVQELPF